jgi:flavine halogenase
LTDETGRISFKYVVDASGRAGMLHTKYLKDRTYNTTLKNIARWGYWQDVGSYGMGTPRAKSPFFEALIGITGVELDQEHEY